MDQKPAALSKKTAQAILLTGLAFFSSIFCFRTWGDGYSIDWHKAAGGAGTSTGGVYSVSGTIGQPDAVDRLSGGAYSVMGGFWSLISVVQTEGAPLLAIACSGNSIIISWPLSPEGFRLQQTSSLNVPAWTNSSFAVTTNQTICNITITAPTNRLFFRLKK